MEKLSNTSSYEATDSSRKNTHVYATLSEDKDTDCRSRSTNQYGSSNGEYTYADTTNVDYITKQQNGDHTSNVKRKVLIVISFIVGVVVGMAITSAGYLIVKTIKTSATDDDLIEEPPNGNKSFTTPEIYQFKMLRCELGDSPFNQQFISFSVKACADAYLVLTSQYDDSGSLVEIAIGINGDTRSAIRTVKLGGNRVVTRNSLLNCENFNRFWISWKNSNVSVGLGSYGNQDTFMSFRDDRRLAIINIGISTGLGSTGEWLFVA